MKYSYKLNTLVFLFIFVFSQTNIGCSKSVSKTEGKTTGLSFVRSFEPKEHAFTILVPQGWKSDGGFFRVDPLQAGGPINSMEAKCDLTYKNDDRGTLSFRILPDIVYAHVGVGAGFFQPGSYYQGAQVRAFEDAKTHIQSLFSNLRPQATAIKVVKITRLPGEIRAMEQSLSYTNRLLSQMGMGSMVFQSDAAGAVYEYIENGVNYREILLTGIIDMRAALTWKNTRTLAFRAPVDEFERWRPVMDIMRFSVRFNPQWIKSEAQGQQERADIVMKVHEEMRRIDREILQKTKVNREEIMNDNFLVLTAQEEYVNSETGEVEMDTDAFKYRWKTSNGDIYYTNNEEENPNTFFHKTDYKLTPIRKRKNE